MKPIKHPGVGVVHVVETRTRAIQVGQTTVLFKPGEVIRDPHKLALARENDVALGTLQSV